MKKDSPAYRVAFTALLFALALALSVFESYIASFMPLPPGVKPGLANIVLMYALLFLSKKQALVLAVLKAGFAMIIRGAVAGLLSLSGGLLSFVIMALIIYLVKDASLLLISVAGATAHNIGQFAVVILMFGKSALVYLPVLIIFGIVMGIFTSVILKVTLPALEKSGLHISK